MMGSASLNGKRRRAEHAASALSKPFKSPLRRPPQTSGTKEEALRATEKNISTVGSVPEAIDRSTKAEQTRSTLSTPIPSCTTVGSLSSNSSSLHSQTRKRKSLADCLTPSKKPLLFDPEIQELQKQERALQSRLSALRSELDTARQALRVESSDKHAELENLITKWKSVSQNAAEEVFAGAQERVSRFGGMKAWREQTKSSGSRWEQEEMESWYGNAQVEGADLDDDELESRKAEMLDQYEVSRKEFETTQRGDSVEEEEFTMDFMLKTLNIEAKMIGYDKYGQKWIKD
ncbi:hypothetical protein EYZ11_007607 [Aspergillus tanneri]|uniref:Swi5-dependent recombination DNA repair protein 1 n=1 Tax=Aspergillus tanneri TaxID=1220188 RepID=A0A4S3JI71_9EURO|nr:uncharacterized protein ATNIH1004_000504 [Aspergillus tanneri]KAA8651614.1 hypothetical protein ATNIH1004_000504 [Aspergillus tanneri]THC92911.1 hypothetical protein EYZ11_007607 [Aspergillus tanneri]